MRARYISAALLALFNASAVLAADEPLTPARIVGAGPNSGDVLLGALKLGKRQGGVFSVTAPVAGPIDAGTVGGTALPAILGSKAPLASPAFTGTVTAPSYAGDASGMTAPPSAAAPAGSIARMAYTLAQTAYYMPSPSGSAATDAANFAAAQATGARTIVFGPAPDTNPYLVPPSAYPELRSNQGVTGQGPGKTILRITGQATYGEGMLYALEESDLMVSNLTLDYANFPAPTANAGTLKFRGSRNVRVENVDITNYPKFGLAIDGGSNFAYLGGTITRSSSAKYASGDLMPKGVQNQCVTVSSASSVANNILFQDLKCVGSAFNTDGYDFTYNMTDVQGFDFGFAYVTEQNLANGKRHKFFNVKASGGRTNPATGLDENNTGAGCLEIWTPDSVIDNATCDDLGGNGIDIGGKNSRIINSRFAGLGKQVAASGIRARYAPGVGFVATGTLIANNTVVNSNGSGDGSNLVAAYSQESNAPDLVVTLTGNEFGNAPMTEKGQGARWSAPGMLVARTAGGYTHPGGTRQSPTDLHVPGIVRAKDAVLAANYKANDGSPLPSNLRIFAVLDFDNSVRWYIESLSGGDTPVPAGTYSARIITVN